MISFDIIIHLLSFIKIISYITIYFCRLKAIFEHEGAAFVLFLVDWKRQAAAASTNKLVSYTLNKLFPLFWKRQLNTFRI
ncbi:hypothetical protein RZ52_06100 [Bacillus velezensis]|nr:hypothetical protein RZ52_06100 [Bacillus velezensis]